MPGSRSPLPRRRFGSILAGQWKLTKKYQWPMWRGNFIGIIIGVLPGAGADMAAWVSYAMAKKFSKEPEKFGTGHPEGLVESGASNNASLASGWGSCSARPDATSSATVTLLAGGGASS